MSVITALEQEHGIDLDLAQTQLPSVMEGTDYWIYLTRSHLIYVAKAICSVYDRFYIKKT